MGKKILVLNSSPRIKGNTAMLCDTFVKGAESAGHSVRDLTCNVLKFTAVSGV